MIPIIYPVHTHGRVYYAVCIMPCNCVPVDTHGRVYLH